MIGALWPLLDYNIKSFNSGMEKAKFKEEGFTQLKSKLFSSSVQVSSQ